MVNVPTKYELKILQKTNKSAKLGRRAESKTHLSFPFPSHVIQPHYYSLRCISRFPPSLPRFPRLQCSLSSDTLACCVASLAIVTALVLVLQHSVENCSVYKWAFSLTDSSLSFDGRSHERPLSGEGRSSRPRHEFIVFPARELQIRCLNWEKINCTRTPRYSVPVFWSFGTFNLNLKRRINSNLK